MAGESTTHRRGVLNLFALWPLCALLVVACFAGALPTYGESPLFPLTTGTQWVYEGTVKWTEVGGPVKTKRLRWVTTLVSVQSNQHTCVALVRGFPDQLAWYNETNEPALSVFVLRSNRVYQICSVAETEPHALAASLIADPKALPEPAEVLLDLPLVPKKSYGGDTDREDHWYCWHVTGQKQRRLKIRGAEPNHARQVFSVAYRTCPDHQIMEWADGLGLLRYAYEHHGTVASADVRLVEFRQK